MAEEPRSWVTWMFKNLQSAADGRGDLTKHDISRSAERRRAVLLGTAALVLALSGASSSSAQVRTDGSVGPAQTLAGPNHAISANLGQQVGGNLFHSFSSF